MSTPLSVDRCRRLELRNLALPQREMKGRLAMQYFPLLGEGSLPDLPHSHSKLEAQSSQGSMVIDPFSKLTDDISL